jgi:branched-chain amino acid transport system ATP-binding protein
LPAKHPELRSKVLDVRNMTAGYGDVPAVHDVSVAVDTGEVVALLGPNGAGKSTLLRAVVGEARVMAGSVFLKGQEVTGAPADRLARLGLGYVPQSENVFRTLTVAENLRMGGYLLPRHSVAEHIARVLELFPDLARLLRAPVGRLSGGEQRLVAIGRALMLEPRVLLLDEPTANLSPRNASRVLGEYVLPVAAEGAGVLLVEQRAREALLVADRVFVFSAGRVVFAGGPDELTSGGDVGRIFLGEIATHAMGL